MSAGGTTQTGAIPISAPSADRSSTSGTNSPLAKPKPVRPTQGKSTQQAGAGPIRTEKPMRDRQFKSSLKKKGKNSPGSSPGKPKGEVGAGGAKPNAPKLVQSDVASGTSKEGSVPRVRRKGKKALKEESQKTGTSISHAHAGQAIDGYKGKQPESPTPQPISRSGSKQPFDFSSDFVNLEVGSSTVAGPSAGKQAGTPAVVVAERVPSEYPADEKMRFVGASGKFGAVLSGLSPFFNNDLTEFRRLVEARWTEFDAAVSTLRIRAKPHGSKTIDVDSQEAWDSVARFYASATSESPISVRLSRPNLPVAEEDKTKNRWKTLGRKSRAGSEMASMSGMAVEDGDSSKDAGQTSGQKQDTEVPTGVPMEVAETSHAGLAGPNTSPQAESPSPIAAKQSRGGKRKRAEDRAAKGTVPAVGDSSPSVGIPARALELTLNGSETGSESSSPPAKRRKRLSKAQRAAMETESSAIAPAAEVSAPIASINSHPIATSASASTTIVNAKGLPKAAKQALPAADRFKPAISSPLAVSRDDPMEGIETESTRSLFEGMDDAEIAAAAAQVQALTAQLEAARQLMETIKRKKAEAKEAEIRENLERARKAAEEAERATKAEEAARLAAEAEARAAAKEAKKLEKERAKQEAAEAAEATARELAVKEAMEVAAAKKRQEQAEEDAKQAAKLAATAIKLVTPKAINGDGKKDLTNPVELATPTPKASKKRAAQSSTAATQEATAPASSSTPQALLVAAAKPVTPSPALKQSKEAAALAAWRAAHPSAKIVIPVIPGPSSPAVHLRHQKAVPTPISTKAAAAVPLPPSTASDSGSTEHDADAEQEQAYGNASPTQSKSEPPHPQGGPMSSQLQDVDMPGSSSNDDSSVASKGEVATRHHADPLMARLPSSEPESFSSEETEKDPYERVRARATSPGSDYLEPEGDDDADMSDDDAAGPPRPTMAAEAHIAEKASEVDPDTSDLAGIEPAQRVDPASPSGSPMASLHESDPDRTDSRASSQAASSSSGSQMPTSDQEQPTAELPASSRASFADLNGPPPTQPTLSGTVAFFAAIDAEAQEDLDALGRVQDTTLALSPEAESANRPLSPLVDQPGTPSPFGGQGRSLIPSSSLDIPGAVTRTPKAKQRMLMKDGSPAVVVEPAPAKRGRGRPPKIAVNSDETGTVQSNTPAAATNGEETQAASVETASIQRDQASLSKDIMRSSSPIVQGAEADGSVAAPVSPLANPTQPAPDQPEASLPVVPKKPARPKVPIHKAMNRNPCVLCDAVPSHLQKDCPVIIAGLPSIERRMAELRADNEQDHESALEKLEGWVNRLRNAKRSALISGAMSGSDSGMLDPELDSSSSYVLRAKAGTATMPARTASPAQSAGQGEIRQDEHATETMLSAPLNESSDESIKSHGSTRDLPKGGDDLSETAASPAASAAPAEQPEDIVMKWTQDDQAGSDSDATEPESDVDMDAPASNRNSPPASIQASVQATPHATIPTPRPVPLPSPALSQAPSLSYNPRSDIPSLSSLRPDVLRKPRLSSASLHNILVPATQVSASINGSSRLGSRHSGSESASGSGAESGVESSDTESESDEEGASKKKTVLPAALAGRMAGLKAASKAKKANEAVEGW